VEFVGNIRDISGQKAAEDELAAANTALAALSETDALTGLANRRHFDACLQREWNRAARHASTLALLMIDVDFFKTYNDLYGHVTGDHCLQTIGTLMQNLARRSGEIAARYGGEEFAVILPDTTIETALYLADKLRESVAGHAIIHAGNPQNHVTVSIGVAALSPIPGTPPDTLIRTADHALYQAKQTGRDRIVSAETPPEPKTIAPAFTEPTPAQPAFTEPTPAQPASTEPALAHPAFTAPQPGNPAPLPAGSLASPHLASPRPVTGYTAMVNRP
jgi:diguanylate cyclase (GGDEF)-like protein